jgi:uncharacterized protein YwqG
MDIPQTIQPFKKPAWIPITQDGDGPVTGSKFSGTPWLSEGETWPVCPICHQPMQLFVQLRLDELPSALKEQFGSGLLQMFYCVNGVKNEPCEVVAKAWFPFSKAHVVRIVQPLGEAQQILIPQGMFPAKKITGWQEVEDYPSPAEYPNLGVSLNEDEIDELYDKEILPQAGEKLAGWPNWIQGVEYPTCPECKKLMRLVFQIDSVKNLPFMFGDVGCGHITQCETHKHILAFGWACS